MSQIKVSIIVPTFRRPEVLQVTLESLLNLDYPKDEYEVIVVDDGSDDSTPEIVKEEQSGFKNLVYLYQENKGVATARNHGAKMAQGDFLIFNDDDIIVPPDLITRHREHSEAFGNCLINGHWEFPPEMRDYFENTPFGRFRVSTEVWVKTENEKKHIINNVYQSQTVSACNCGLKKADFWKIGGYDETFPYAGFEDHEFCLRALKAGYKLIYDYDIKLLHNDHRIDFQQFGERQRRGAITKVLLAVKNPETEASHSMIVENGFRHKNDSFKLSLKKNIKNILSKPIIANSLFATIKVLEVTTKNTSLLSSLYKVSCGIYIFRGIRQGMAKYGDPRLPEHARKTFPTNS